MIHKDWENVIHEQKKVCEQHGATWVQSTSGSKVGISADALSGKIVPINGLRHPVQKDTTGWYIWAGEDEIPSDPNYFKPLHVEHLIEKCPHVLKYLGLPPGYRFQIDCDGYEDVWEDATLLNVSLDDLP